MQQLQLDSTPSSKHGWSLYCTCDSCTRDTHEVINRLFSVIAWSIPERRTTNGSSPEAAGGDASSEGNSLGSSLPTMDVTKSTTYFPSPEVSKFAALGNANTWRELIRLLLPIILEALISAVKRGK